MSDSKEDNITKTICALVHSGYQQELVEDWLSKWDNEISYEEVKHSMNNVMSIWRVDGPQEAFDELPFDVMAKKYKNALQDELSDYHFT